MHLKHDISPTISLAKYGSTFWYNIDSSIHPHNRCDLYLQGQMSNVQLDFRTEDMIESCITYDYRNYTQNYSLLLCKLAYCK